MCLRKNYDNFTFKQDMSSKFEHDMQNKYIFIVAKFQRRAFLAGVV